MKLYIDPPSGWRYGFPKQIDKDFIATPEWFLQQGYPQELINQGMLDHTRYFSRADDE